MTRPKITNEDLKDMQNTVTVLHGVFDESFFTLLAERNPQRVFVLEGRPDFESAKNNIRNLHKVSLRATVIADNMAGFLFYKKLVKEVWVAHLGVNKKGVLCHIGASILGVLCKKHQIPMFCYPSTKIDARKKKLLGTDQDIITFQKQRIAPKGVQGYVPLLEWFPAANFGLDEEGRLDSHLKKCEIEKKKELRRLKYGSRHRTH